MLEKKIMLNINVLTKEANVAYAALNPVKRKWSLDPIIMFLRTAKKCKSSNVLIIE